MSYIRLFQFSQIHFTSLLVASALGSITNEPTATTQFLNYATGSTLRNPAIGAILNNSSEKGAPEFYKPIKTYNSSEALPELANLSPKAHAALLYSAFNAGQPSVEDKTILTPPIAENWDASAPLKDEDFDKIIKPLAFEENSPFEYIAGVRQFNQGGLGAVAYKEKATDKIHIFVVGLETDNPTRDFIPDIQQLLFKGMKDQTHNLKAFVEAIQQQYPNQLASLTGQSLGTIPTAKVAYEIGNPNIQTILVEPRMNGDLAKELVPENTNHFKDWYESSTTSLVVGANAWNSFRVETLGEKPAIISNATLAFTNDGDVLKGAPIIGMGIVASPHQASKSSLKLAQEEVSLTRVDANTVPRNGAEVLQYRGAADTAVAALLGAIATFSTVIGAATAEKKAFEALSNLFKDHDR